ncbi:hypothetical protein EVAR_37247_1 [Eumeta japonica]|uniref:Uncharacterized protein n=1 Tax=Eumeta variegata TaxID=151549 RepID=A0A4C1Y8H6_EUMVA|nr:hypothetical protein EVAR_37247_1 [Eumeta japonica]
MSSLLPFGLGSGLSGRRWRLRLPVRILSVQTRGPFQDKTSSLSNLMETKQVQPPRQTVEMHDSRLFIVAADGRVAARSPRRVFLSGTAS